MHAPIRNNKMFFFSEEHNWPIGKNKKASHWWPNRPLFLSEDLSEQGA
jgi:hypothetical protein